MINIRHLLIIALLSPNTLLVSQITTEDTIRAIDQKYVNSWLVGDEEGVMGLFEENATINPNRLAPISGLDAIRQFWFPKDSSVTTIHNYTLVNLNISIDGSLAVSTSRSFLSWSYRKGTISMARDQSGYAMTVYRRQTDGQWKIWRRLWTDVKVIDR